MRKVLNIAGLGEVLWDFYEDERFAGGAPANFAFHATRCGARGFLMSRVGQDELGRSLMDHFKQAGVNITGVQTSPQKPTGTVRIHLDASGQPSFECSSDTAFDEMEMDTAWLKLINRLDVILFGTLAQRAAASRQAIRALLDHAKETVRIFDLNLRGWNAATREIVEESLCRCRILKLNETELQILIRAQKAEHLKPEVFLRGLLRSCNIELAAVTLGSRGCWLLTPDEEYRHPGYRVDVVDTTGCGDAFAAGLAWCYLHHESLEETAGYANRIAAFVATKKGATPVWNNSDLLNLDETEHGTTGR
ncbi:MAG TPA: carbohydrate kinase [bacterium]|nr:carbohydrate kinase [bacterium]